MVIEQASPRFDTSHGATPADTVVAGFTQFGLAGLTAVDYLADQLQVTECGHVTATGLPPITPFDEGTPRHHTRLFGGETSPIGLLVGELFVPMGAAPAFGEAVLEWFDQGGVDEVMILSGVPVSHGPDQHDTFYVATDDFQSSRLSASDIPPMGSGFLDGVNGALVERGIDSDLAVGVLVTPVHAQTPDVEAALRLLSTTIDLYDLSVDVGPLETFAAEVAQHYADLQRRMENTHSEESLPEDRMYM